MSRTSKDIRDTEQMLQRLTSLLQQHYAGGTVSDGPCLADAEQLRRISMTLHRWHELECGTDGGYIERGRLVTLVDRGTFGERGKRFESDENGAPYFANHRASGLPTTYTKIPDREKGALARLVRVMARYPSLSFYVQGDPRGCALYILRPGDVPAGESADAYYSRGLAVHQ